MGLLLLVLLLVMPFVELFVAIQVASVIGALWTLVALAGFSILGLVLIRSEGLAVWRRANAELAAGRMPTRSLVDGVLVLVGGLLMIVPGFVTGVLGLLLLLPPVRALVRPLLVRWMERRVARGAGVVTSVHVGSFGGPTSTSRSTRSPWGTVIGGTVVDVEGRDAAGPDGIEVEIVDVQVDEPPELGPGTDRPA